MGRSNDLVRGMGRNERKRETKRRRAASGGVGRVDDGEGAAWTFFFRGRGDVADWEGCGNGKFGWVMQKPGVGKIKRDLWGKPW